MYERHIKRASDLYLKRSSQTGPTVSMAVSNVCLYWQAIIHVLRRGMNIIYSLYRWNIRFMCFFHMVVKKDEDYL